MSALLYGVYPASDVICIAASCPQQYPRLLFFGFQLAHLQPPSICLFALTGEEHRNDVRAVPLRLRGRHTRVQGVSRGGYAGAQRWRGYRTGRVLQGQCEESGGVGCVYGAIVMF